MILHMKTFISIALLFGGLSAMAQLPSESWIAQAQHSLEAQEYYFTYDEARSAFQCPNRNHDFRSLVREDGLEVISRFDHIAGENWLLKLVPIGISAETGRIPTVTRPTSRNFDQGTARMEYPQFIAAFINDKEGLEFTFTLHAPSGGRGDKQFLTELITSLHVETASSEEFIFYHTSGDSVLPKLKLHKLKLIDAAGVEIPSTMSVIFREGRKFLSIDFDDRGAQYPITIDPLISTPSWSYISSTSDKLGYSAQIIPDINGDGYDDILAGAPNYDAGSTDEGRAVLFLGSATGASAAPVWSVESNQTFGHMGHSVTYVRNVNGDAYGDVVVGASDYDNGSTNEGRVYLYYGNATGLNATHAWTYENNQSSSYVGNFVCSAGDVNGDGYGDLAIGTAYYNGTFTDCGRVYVFHGSATGFPAAANWTNTGTSSSQYLGNAVAGDLDVNADGYDDLVVAAYYSDNPEVNEGRIFLFYGSATGLSISPVWTDDGDVTNRYLGKYVVGLGDANGDGYDDFAASAESMINPLNGLNTGAVFVYYGASTYPASVPLDTLYGQNNNDKFGYTLGGGGDFNADGYNDLLVASANVAGGPEGKAYLFKGSIAGIEHDWVWTHSGYDNDESATYFEKNISLDGDVNNDGLDDLLIGITSFTGKGSLRLFFGGDIIPVDYPGQFTTGNQTGAKFGFSIAGNGDVNNDGFTDVVIGAPFFDSGSTDEGKVFLYRGSADSLTHTIAWSAEGNQVSAQFGAAIEFLGDFNNDGYDDLIVGAPLYDNYFLDEGKLYIYKGTATGIQFLATKTFVGGQAGAKLGYAVSSAPKLNGDTYADFVASAPYYNVGLAGQGRVLGYTSTGTTFSNTPYFTLSGSQTNENFGFALDASGDVNADGYSDILVGSPLYDGTFTDEGRARLYLGGPGYTGTPNWTYSGGQASGQLGFSLSHVGRTSDRIYGDVVVGQPYFDNGQTDEGRMYFFSGNATGLSVSPGFSNEADSASALMGYGVFALGDISDDGYADFAVSLLNGEYDSLNQGILHVFLGTSIGTNTVLNAVSIGIKKVNQFGFSVSAGGDLNGDGINDFLIGAPLTDGAFIDQGAVFLQYGQSTSCDSIFPGLTFEPDTFGIDISYADFDETRRIDLRYRPITETIWSYDTTTSATGKLLVGLTACTPYLIEIQKACVSGSTAWQTSDTIVTLGCPADCGPYVISGISVTGITNTSATLNWTSPVPVYAYDIEYRKSGAAIWITGTSFINSFTLSALDSCSEYEYRIRSNCGPSFGPWSVVNTFTTLGACIPTCPAPTGLFYTGLTPTSVMANWAPVVGATKYRVGYHVIGGPWQYVNTTTNSKTLTGLTPGTNYEFNVKTFCGLITSDFSAPIPFTTPLRMDSGDPISFSLYPNPSNGSFILWINDCGSANAQVVISDLTGKEVYQGHAVCGTENIIRFDPAASGAYYLRIVTAERTEFALIEVL